MAVTMNARWDDTGTVIPGGDAEYVVAEQPIAEYDNWFNYNIVADVQAVIDDVINRFNANTILKADTDNTPAALVVAEQTIVGRKTGNSIAALTDAEVRTILNVEDGSTADQSNTEIRDAVEAAADSNTFDDADHTKLNGIESTADVTDATNVTAAGAVMDGDFSATEGMMRKTGAGAYTVIKSNLDAAVAPTVDEDSGDGYGVGSQWVDTTADNSYICIDATVAAAVWKMTSLSPDEWYVPLTDDVYASNDALVAKGSTTGYEKFKESELAAVTSDIVRISFTLSNTLVTTFHGRIYRNGAAVGTDRTVGNGVTETFIENISGWSPGDLLQVYGYMSDSGTGRISELRILGITIAPFQMTNQDP